MWLEIKTCLTSEAVPSERKAPGMNTTDPLPPLRLSQGLSREVENFNKLLKLGHTKPTKKMHFKLRIAAAKGDTFSWQVVF